MTLLLLKVYLVRHQGKVLHQVHRLLSLRLLQLGWTSQASRLLFLSLHHPVLDLTIVVLHELDLNARF